MEEGFFKYDEKTDREWFEIELRRSGPYSRARIQDYARCTKRSPKDWVLDAIVWFMHECDRQGAHGSPTPVRKPVEREPIPAWKRRIADRMYGWADELSGASDQDEQYYD